MNELDKKIIELFKVIYDLNNDDINEITNTIKDLTDEEKKSTIVALYERYKSMIDNSNILQTKLQSVKNNYDEHLEEINTNDIILNF